MPTALAVALLIVVIVQTILLVGLVLNVNKILDRASGILAAERHRGIGLVAALDDAFDETQEADIERVVAAADAFVLTVSGEEELFQIVATDRDEIGHLEELPGREGEARGLQHRADLDAFGQDVSK